MLGFRRLQSTAPAVPSPPPRAAHYNATIRTLDSRRLGPGDVIELTALRWKWIYDRHYLVQRKTPTKLGCVWQFRRDASRVEFKQRGTMRLVYTAKIDERPDDHSPAYSLIPFPPNTRGWFYYYLPPHRPAVAGEVRFRLAPTAGPLDFESGSDLLLPIEIPFNIPLIRIAGEPTFEMLRNILLRDGLVEPSVIEHCIRIREARQFESSSRSIQYLSSLQDTLLMNLGHHSVEFKAWANDELHDVRVVGRFGHWFESNTYVMPYEGLVAVRLERSTLPIHDGKRMLLFRVVKIPKPIRCVVPDYDGTIQMPSEGSFIMRRWQPVSINLDSGNVSSRFAPLGVLYDQDAAASQS